MSFQYKMTQRPFGIGCQPKGAVSCINGNKAKDGYHSIAVYNIPLTPEQVKDFELTPVTTESYEVQDQLRYQGVERFTTYDDAFRFAYERADKTGVRQFIKKITSQYFDLVIPLNESPKR